MENLNGKRLLLLGGSLWKDDIKNFAIKYGIVLIATGTNKNAGIFDIADEYYDIDSTDGEKMKKLILEKNIDGVYMGGSEPVISSACQYLNEINLPCYCTKEQWEKLQNKVSFKNLCREFDLPVVENYDASLEQILNQHIKIEFPVITKPSDGSGSNGFSVNNNFNELENGYRKALENSSSKSVMIEKFVKNDSLVVFYTLSGGKIYFSGIEDKYPVKYPEQGSFVAGMHLFESSKKNTFRYYFEEKIKKMFNSLDIKEGSIWIEVFYDNNNFYFNEAGYRYSGSVSIYPVDYFYGINQLTSDLYFSLTGKSYLKELGSKFDCYIDKKKYYCIYSIHLKAGKIKNIVGNEDILLLDSIISMPMTMNKDSIVCSSGSVGQVFAFVHFDFNTIEELKKIIEKIHTTLQVYDENGENMIVKLLDTEDIQI